MLYFSINPIIKGLSTHISIKYMLKSILINSIFKQSPHFNYYLYMVIYTYRRDFMAKKIGISFKDNNLENEIYDFLKEKSKLLGESAYIKQLLLEKMQATKK